MLLRQLRWRLRSHVRSGPSGSFIYESNLRVLETWPSETHGVRALPPAPWVLFTFLPVSLKAQKCEIVTKSSLSTLSWVACAFAVSSQSLRFVSFPHMHVTALKAALGCSLVWGASHSAVPESFQKFSRASGGRSVHWDRRNVLTQNAHRLQFALLRVPACCGSRVSQVTHTTCWTARHGTAGPEASEPERAASGGGSRGKRSPWASAVASALSPPETASHQHWGHHTGVRAPGSARQPRVLERGLEVSCGPVSEELGVPFRGYMGSSYRLFVFS